MAAKQFRGSVESLFNAQAFFRSHGGMSSELLHSIIAASGTAVFFHPATLNPAGELVFKPVSSDVNWSLNLRRLLGTATEPINLEEFFSCIHAADRSSMQACLADAVRTGLGEANCEYRIVCTNGSVRWVLSRYIIECDAMGQLQYIAGVCFDITERKQAQESIALQNAQLHQAQHYLHRALSSSGIAIYRHCFGTDGEKTDYYNGDANSWNYNVAELYGYPPGTEVTPRLMGQRMHPDDMVLVQEKSEQARLEGVDEYQVEFRLREDDGSVRWLLLKSGFERDGNGNHQSTTGALIDITERKCAEDRIQYLATHDGLTGLPNRVMFSNLLNHTLDTAKRYSHNFALLFIDLDRFKAINDALGHQSGDVLLQEIGERLRACARASDVVARLSGDEFVILLQEVSDKQQASTFARKIIAEVMKPITLREQECRVTASVGICLFPEHGDDEQTLMKNADTAMYMAKEEGKNNFQFYSANIKSHSLERMALENQLRSALERDELSLQYQAKLDLHNNRISGVEALLRWNNPEFGSISPAQFIPIAEETGLIVPIGRWVLNTACAQQVAWQAQGLPPVCIAVNLSPRQFLNNGLLDHVQEALSKSGMRPEFLELEITESMVMHNVEQALQLLHAIKALGVRIAIDDFGTGYSSLAQLKRFPIDTLKVDRSFIREVVQDADDQAITEAIIAMGKSLSLTIVAEGVETQEQQDFLRSSACDEMQGYYFSRPVAAAEFAELLHQHTAALPA